MKNKKETIEKPHIGKIIQEKVNKSGMSVTEFAEKINLSRPAVYQMFNKQSVDCELLFRISMLLNENFFELLHHETEKMLRQTSNAIKEPCNVHNIRNNIENKLDRIHQDLVNIKNILIEMKELKV